LLLCDVNLHLCRWGSGARGLGAFAGCKKDARKERRKQEKSGVRQGWQGLAGWVEREHVCSFSDDVKVSYLTILTGIPDNSLIGE